MLRPALGLVALLVAAVLTTDAGPSANVAYRRLDLHDAVTGESFPVAVWYPTAAPPAPLFVAGDLSACRLPAMRCRWIAFEMRVAPDAAPAPGSFGLVVISHGAAGLAVNHHDLAMALAASGYVAAAPKHPLGAGNDISGPGVWVGRPRQVSGIIDAMTRDPALGPRIDQKRIGVVGHSNGGYTALSVAGARPTPTAIIEHCRRHPDDTRFCSCGGAATREATAASGAIPDVHDRRVRAIVVMAPNVAPFTDEALSRVAVPVRIYGAERDDLTRVTYHTERLARALPAGAEYRVVERAGHFSFVTRFPAALQLLAGEAARDPDGVDRDALHAAINPEIVGFFDRKLRAAPR